jgi:formamidopyrimidine-DNA glycosylase
VPELPDVTVYAERLDALVCGHTLRRVLVPSPIVLRTALPPIAGAGGRIVTGVSRLGKRIVIALEGGLQLVLHLVVAGRLRWLAPVQRIVHTENQTNCCARCQTGGKLLGDRALGTPLKADWPRRIDDVE